jgi:lipopolysaccharide transport system ATP-binding protein
MSDVAIRVENLSKQYRIGGPQGRYRYRTIRESLVEAAQAPFRRLSSVVRGQSSTVSNETIWALKDVSFEVKQGEVVGIIGRNGAGKTTLLKVLSRITEPTEGYAEIHGRVGSLLEVGTGFHPELTGRENIYLNGAILGMKRAEIERKFDEIVAFAEIEKFMDTPVKHYSSGMYVRLAFAVAAHLEPEILLVDEVLAVGDAAFQKKCLGKMRAVAGEGRTVLFVSHNMAAIANLCGRCILLDEGQIRSVGFSKDVINHYLCDSQQDGIQKVPGEYDLTNRRNPYLQDKLVIRKVQLLNSRGKPQDTFLMGQEMTIVVDVEGMSDYHDAWIGIIFKSRDDQWLAGISTGMTCSHVDQPRQKRELAILRVPQLPFTPGSYWIGISVTHGRLGRIDYVDRAAQFFVAEADVYSTGYQVSAHYGVVYLNATWEIRGGDWRDESS